jgi:hypothetical protein
MMIVTLHDAKPNESLVVVLIEHCMVGDDRCWPTRL